jgi:integrase
MKPIIPLNELKIRNLQPKPKIYKVFDGGGLYLEVLPSGTKVWRLKHKVNNKDTRTNLGKYPIVSLKTARESAAKLKSGIIEPVTNLYTVKELCGDWAKQFEGSVTLKTWKRKQYYINKCIIPQIGIMDVKSLTAGIILEKVLKPIDEKGIQETAHKLKITISQILRFGVATGKVERDYTLDLRGVLSPIRVKHYPTILDKYKIGRLILDIKHYSGSPIVSYALKILPYLFVRPGELRHAEWVEIDFKDKIWRISADKMKLKRQHLVPLSNQVIIMLEELKEISGNGQYLFPGSRTKIRPISDAAINAALRYLGYNQDEMTGHGFRAMASTLLNEMGYNSDWIERQLAHVETNGVRAAYNHADYLPERRKMMQYWADFLDKLAADALIR